MKFALAAIFLVASVMALGGIAAATPGPASEGVAVSGSITPYLNFVVTEAAGGITLNPTMTPSSEYISQTPTGDSIDTNADWAITVNIPVYKMQTTSGPAHTLQNPLDVIYNWVGYNGVGTYAVQSGTPTGGVLPFYTSYGQQYSLTDYSGSYGTTVTWTATPTF